MERPGVSIALVRTLVDEVARAGIAAEDFLARAGFADAPLADANARVPLDAYDRLQELALDLTGDPALGLHMGARAPLVTFDMVGAMSPHCSTIREAIEIFRRYRRLVSDCDAPSLVEQGSLAILTFYFIRSSERCSRLRAELGITALVRFAFLSAVDKPRSAIIEFEHGAPPHAPEYERVLGFPVVFGRSATRIVFERRILDEPQLHADAEVERLLEGQANRKLQALSTPPSASAHVRALVAHCGGGRPSQGEIARRMSLSPRSLRRRLRAEGVSFVEVAEAAVADVARQLLRDPTTTIQQVAARLGFSESSAFHRAFKRWTGLTPTEFREGRSSPRS